MCVWGWTVVVAASQVSSVNSRPRTQDPGPRTWEATRSGPSLEVAGQSPRGWHSPQRQGIPGPQRLKLPLSGGPGHNLPWPRPPQLLTLGSTRRGVLRLMKDFIMLLWGVEVGVMSIWFL